MRYDEDDYDPDYGNLGEGPVYEGDPDTKLGYYSPVGLIKVGEP